MRFEEPGNWIPLEKNASKSGFSRPLILFTDLIYSVGVQLPLRYKKR
jgi:hypothetical protein